MGRASNRREVEEAFAGAASLLGLDHQSTSVSGRIDDFEVESHNYDGESGSGLVARVYLDGLGLPPGLEVVPWGGYSRMMNVWGWLPFFTTYRKIDCPQGQAKGVYAAKADTRDVWLTQDMIERLCALKSNLTTTGLFGGRHYLEQETEPASDTGHVVRLLTLVLDDARGFVR